MAPTNSTAHARSDSWPPWFEARLPTAQECTVPWLLSQRAINDPHGVFLVLEDGGAWSNQQAEALIAETARCLRNVGLAARDRLLIWLPNGPDMFRYLLAAWSLGVTPVSINPALRGSPLSHVLEIASAKVVVTHTDLIARLTQTAQIDRFTAVLVPGTAAPEILSAGLPVRAESAFMADQSPLQTSLREPWELAAVIFSSGTTGIPKGVMVPFAQLWSLGRSFYGYLREDDRMLLMYPLFHIAGLGALFGALSAGASLALTESFRASEFLSVVRSTGSTSAPGLGRTLVDALNKLPRCPDDAENPLRVINVQSVNAAVREFAERFQCEVVPAYSMTETSGICLGVPGETKDGSIGRPRSGLEVRIVNAQDIPVSRGQPGEVIVRADLPWVLNAGYFGNPQATAAAWRNGWFHTGDIARQDEDGDLYFLDRTGDVIRRRSENISSLEIEAEARQHPSVQDAAAIGIETAEGEEVLLVVAPQTGSTIDPPELFHFLIARLPHYMVPRFVRTVAELPKTQTNRVQKAELRRAGLTADCQDREALGIRVKRQRLR